MKPNIKANLLLFIFLIAGQFSAQTIDQKLAAALQHTLDSMHQQLNIKGIGASLQLSDGAIWAGGSGISSLSPLDSIRPEHTFAIASVTKTITAACILQLVDEEVLTLDDVLEDWLPTYEHINPQITIKQLLRHESGIYDVLLNPAFQPMMANNTSQIWSLDNILSTFIEPANFQPGTSWGYSNSNYLLLGMIIEAATGNTYTDEFEERFFIPFDLESFSLPAFNPLPAEVAHLWLDITGDGIIDDAHFFFSNWLSLFSAVGPAGSYFATPGDMAQWMKTCMNGSLYTESTWQAAKETVSTGLPGNTKYGLGIMERNYLGFTGYGHGGDISYSSSVVYFPEKDLSIAVHANDANINSWALNTTVQALLKTFLDCELLLNESAQITAPKIMFSVSPNPFFEKVTINLELPAAIDQFELTMVNLLGDIVWSSNKKKNVGTNHYQLSINEPDRIIPGIYFINLVSNDQRSYTIKTIKL